MRTSTVRFPRVRCASLKALTISRIFIAACSTFSESPENMALKPLNRKLYAVPSWLFTTGIICSNTEFMFSNMSSLSMLASDCAKLKRRKSTVISRLVCSDLLTRSIFVSPSVLKKLSGTKR